MEKDKNPEIPVAVECMSCGGVVEVNDDTSELWLFTDPAHTQYSFLNVTCDNEGCDNVQSLFVDIEAIEMLSFLSVIYVKKKVPKEFRERVGQAYDMLFAAKEKKWGKKMLEFLEIYQPWAYEFKKHRW